MNKAKESNENKGLQSLDYGIGNSEVLIEGLTIETSATKEAKGNSLKKVEEEESSDKISKCTILIEEGSISLKNGVWSISIGSGDIVNSRKEVIQELDNLSLDYEPDKKSKTSFYNEAEGISIKELTITLDGIKRIFTPKGINEKTIASNVSLTKASIVGAVITILSSMALEKAPNEYVGNYLEDIDSSIPSDLGKILDMNNTINTQKEFVGKVSKGQLLDSIINDNYPSLTVDARKALFTISGVDTGSQDIGDEVYRKNGKVYFYSRGIEHELDGLK